VYLSDELSDVGVSVCALDIESIEQAIAAVLDDPEAARRRTESARQFVLDRYDPVAVAKRTLALYERIIAPRAPRPLRHDAGR
jgi:glycosyltransferase involved in cell wall biosynthesis